MNPAEPCYARVNDLLTRYRISRSTLHRWRQLDFPQPVRLGASTRWRVADLLAWEARHLPDAELGAQASAECA